VQLPTPTMARRCIAGVWLSPYSYVTMPSSFDDKSAVIIIEIAESDIHWMEPRDVLLSDLSMKINDRSHRSVSNYDGGACVVYADGSVELLDDATTEERVRELLAQQSGRDQQPIPLLK
jgi:hypothetical protein